MSVQETSLSAAGDTSYGLAAPRLHLTPTVSDVRAPIMVCLLGEFRLLKHGEEVLVGAGTKAGALLGRLALHLGQGVQREQLISAIWPESDVVLGGQSLSSLVYSLRRLLSDGNGGAAPVLQDHGYYRLNRDAGIEVDVARFEMLTEEGDRLGRGGDADAACRAYARAVSYYGGDLVDDGDIAVVIQRERFRAMYLTILGRLADKSFRDADYEGCLEAALKLLVKDPCREDGHRLVMRCYVRLGRRAQALRQFRICEEILRAEFDATPEPVTRSLFEQIRLDPATV